MPSVGKTLLYEVSPYGWNFLSNHTLIKFTPVKLHTYGEVALC